MTRRDYEMIANLISEADELSLSQRADLMLAFIPRLKSDNERFDAKRFAKACGFPLKAR